MGRPIPDPYKRRVLLPVRVRDGVPRPLYGGDWPSLKEGAVGDLVLPAYAFEDPQAANLLSVPLIVPILREGERLLVGLHPTAHRDQALQPESMRGILQPFTGFAEIRLKEELRLRLRGTKRATLEPCECEIPALEKKTAVSLNEAYRLLSEHFEPHRHSHAGNVFDLIYFEGVGPNRELLWELVEAIRERMEAKLEARFQAPKGAGQRTSGDGKSGG